ncbi:hypothetical protein AYO38_02140 [bacterium SCGC AG-212-C10]|nr:hypothetical protein AYO38_02140 [bacterium SCGC AG-212-C10]
MKPLAVYVHIPFCIVKCGYCDFNAYAGLDHLKPSYQQAVVSEIGRYRELLSTREVTSIAFGGGTPGEVPAADIAAMVRAVRDAAGAVASDAEVALEANPGTTTLDQLRDLRSGGVTRISFGAQSFLADELRFLDRIHSPEAIGASVRAARTAAIPSVGLDLIYGLPGQSLDRWLVSVQSALALGIDHLSLYCLTVEDGTPLARRVARGDVLPLDGDASADQYEAANELLEANGFVHYEVSNWARPGHESQHNQAYWIDRDYLGLGAGAHGYVDGMRYENIASPAAYIEALRLPGSSAVVASYRPDTATAMGDWLATGLRRLAGVDAAQFEMRFGVALDATVGPVLDSCVSAGVLEEHADSYRLTRRGLLLHGEVAAELVAHLQSSAP